MRLKIISVAILAAFSSLSMAQASFAQSVAQVGGPRELPPSSFQGQQFVDSRGCVFLKAGYGGQVNWVPRVNSSRKALCGFPPTFGQVVIEMADEAAPAPRVVLAEPAPRVVAVAPRVAARPAPAIDPATYVPAPVAGVRVAVPAPYVDRAPVRTFEVASSGPGPGKIGCFTSAPVAEVVRLRNGGSAVVCTKGDGGLSGWRSPIYARGAGVGAALTDPVARVAVDPARVTDGRHAGKTHGRETHAAFDAGAIPTPPKGYKLAWTDDRLNPNRGKGTAQGNAEQDRVWTRKVPYTLVADQPRTKRQVIVSTKSEPASAKASGGGALVQVGTFGVPANAAGAASRLAALGLPVARSNITKGGKALQIVYAGPFRSGAEAQAALSSARRAGFGDAFIR